MADSNNTELRGSTGRDIKLLYEAVKAGKLAEVPWESQTLALAMSEHMHLRHVHNALEFADLREDQPYHIEVDGDVLSPLVHVAMHSAVKVFVETEPPVQAAFEKLTATGASAHHAEHVLGVLFIEHYFHLGKAVATDAEVEKARAAYHRKSKKITRDAIYRKKLIRQFPAEHFGFD